MELETVWSGSDKHISIGACLRLMEPYKVRVAIPGEVAPKLEPIYKAGPSVSEQVEAYIGDHPGCAITQIMIGLSLWGRFRTVSSAVRRLVERGVVVPSSPKESGIGRMGRTYRKETR